MKGNDKSMALEELSRSLLIRKHPSCSSRWRRGSCSTRTAGESFADKLVLRRDTWGYGEYEVKSDAAFVRFDRSCVRTTDFAGDVYELPFVINPDCMSIGHNFARITISSARQTLGDQGDRTPVLHVGRGAQRED